MGFSSVKKNVLKSMRPTGNNTFNWDKVFKSGQSKFTGRQPLKNLLSPLLNTLFYMSLS